jgi:tetratricopeptide (TPR) repeat protein
MKKGHLLKMFFLILWVGVFYLNALAADEETLGRQAEETGKLREALSPYVTALQSTPEGSNADHRLREKVIKLALKIQPSPAIPEEARKFSVRGQTSIREAKNPSDFQEAAKEFIKALRIAPWWADGYFNLGLAQEKAGQLNGAIRSLRLYLLASPDAPDGRKVQDQIYALEYRQEKARKETAEKRESEKQIIAALPGDWGYQHGHHRTEERGQVMAPAQIRISGNRIEILNKSYMRGWFLAFRGYITGNKITGYCLWPPVDECPNLESEFPMTALISDEGKRIEMTTQMPRTYYDSKVSDPRKRCTVTETGTNKFTFFKK